MFGRKQQVVLFGSKGSSLVLCLPWVAFISPGLNVLSGNSSLLIVTPVFTECSSVSRRLEKSAGCSNSVRVAAVGGGQKLDCARFHFPPVVLRCAVMWVSGSTGWTTCSTAFPSFHPGTSAGDADSLKGLAPPPR